MTRPGRVCWGYKIASEPRGESQFQVLRPGSFPRPPRLGMSLPHGPVGRARFSESNASSRQWLKNPMRLGAALAARGPRTRLGSACQPESPWRSRCTPTQAGPTSNRTRSTQVWLRLGLGTWLESPVRLGHGPARSDPRSFPLNPAYLVLSIAAATVTLPVTNWAGGWIGLAYVPWAKPGPLSAGNDGAETFDAAA